MTSSDSEPASAAPPSEDVAVEPVRRDDGALPPVATVEQVARHLQVDAKTVRKLLASGKLRGGIVGRHWRIPRASVDALLGDTPRVALPDRALRLARPGRPRRTRRLNVGALGDAPGWPDS